MASDAQTDRREEARRDGDGSRLPGITFTSRDEAQAENYRKMMVAMATDIRVILIKLADRLHNMRTIGAMSKQKQIEKAKEFMENLKVDLFDEEVFVFTPKGEVKSLAAGATPLDFAYEIHTELGHRCVGAKVNSKIVPLNYALKSGDIVEVLTSKRERGPSRDWLAVVKTTRARNKIKQWFKQESREDSEHTGRDLLQEHLRKAGLPAQKLTGSPLLADVIREMGFRKADDFYIALGGAKINAKTVVNKV